MRRARFAIRHGGSAGGPKGIDMSGRRRCGWAHAGMFPVPCPSILALTNMKMLQFPSFRRKAAALFFAIVAFASTATLSAQTVFLTFTGGGGVAPVTVSWSSPITYTLTFTSPNSGVNPYFVFQSVPNGFAAFPVSGTIAGVAPTYSGTGTGSSDGLQTINRLYAFNATHNAVALNDLGFRATTDTASTILTAGDVITLSAGSMVYAAPSNGPYSGTLPTNGFYNTFITDAADVNLGSGMSAVPEPSTYAAIAGAAMLGFAGWTRHRRKTPVAATAVTPVA